MFTYVKLKNYKSLVDFEVDLTSSKNNPKKMIIIYGENGAGKSNFIDAFFTLFDTLNTKIYKTAVDEFMSETSDDKISFGFIFVSFDITKVVERFFTFSIFRS